MGESSGTVAIVTGSSGGIGERTAERLSELGAAVVVVTHDPRVYEFGDRIATMEDGRVVEVHEQTPTPGPGPITPSMAGEPAAGTSSN